MKDYNVRKLFGDSLGDTMSTHIWKYYDEPGIPLSPFHLTSIHIYIKTDDGQSERVGRAFNIFNVVKFTNTPCLGNRSDSILGIELFKIQGKQAQPSWEKLKSQLRLMKAKLSFDYLRN